MPKSIKQKKLARLLRRVIVGMYKSRASALVGS